MTDRHQFFYFIVDRPESRNPEYLLKIGTSNNVKETRLDIEKNRENDLRTYAVYAHADTRVLEKFAQERLSSRELKRGWYKIKKADLDTLLEDMKMIEGVTYTTESKARVSSRNRKPKETSGGEPADAASDEETPAPPPKPAPRPTKQAPPAPEPAPKPAEPALKPLKNTRPAPFPTQQPAAAIPQRDKAPKDQGEDAKPSRATIEPSKPKPRPATPARKPKKKANEDGFDHSLDWD